MKQKKRYNLYTEVISKYEDSLSQLFEAERRDEKPLMTCSSTVVRAGATTKTAHSLVGAHLALETIQLVQHVGGLNRETGRDDFALFVFLSDRGDLGL